MNNATNARESQFLKLVRFLAWYGVAIVFLFYLLPIVGLMADSWYDALSSSARFFSVIGVFAVISAWHVVNTRDRWRAKA